MTVLVVADRAGLGQYLSLRLVHHGLISVVSGVAGRCVALARELPLAGGGAWSAGVGQQCVPGLPAGSWQDGTQHLAHGWPRLAAGSGWWVAREVSRRGRPGCLRSGRGRAAGPAALDPRA